MVFYSPDVSPRGLLVVQYLHKSLDTLLGPTLRPPRLVAYRFPNLGARNTRRCTPYSVRSTEYRIQRDIIINL